ncbi:Activator of HSP90 ATPase [Roseovarius sp. EC-HK134]|uniref:SRPBCC family protein n=1 Tax=unclassified Roseovarius TaxID=2614913 RepID=UPI001256E258|nr:MULTISPECIES: SRPBCC family protein [unclassified Roseovarius]VVT17344.1 Activator of HSP90 ATPase [Roseovarius sp. EC-HK134]
MIMTRQQITVETTVSVSVEEAWSAYTTPDDITQWNFANDDWCCPRVESDLRPGGKYIARMEAKDGSMGFDFQGTYEKIELHKELSLVLDDGRVSRTTFTENSGKTNVATTFDAETRNPTDMQRDGWQAILNNFKAHVDGK